MLDQLNSDQGNFGPIATRLVPERHEAPQLIGGKQIHHPRLTWSVCLPCTRPFAGMPGLNAFRSVQIFSSFVGTQETGGLPSAVIFTTADRTILSDLCS